MFTTVTLLSIILAMYLQSVNGFIGLFQNQVRIPRKFTSLSREIHMLGKDTVQIEFLPANKIVQAKVGANLSDVAKDNGIEINYKCKKGECGTCEVNMNNKWVKTCQTLIPFADNGETLKITVKPPTKKPSKFFSPMSFVEGIINNGAGVVGFVAEGIKVEDSFQQRMEKEAALAARVAAKKKAKESER